MLSIYQLKPAFQNLLRPGVKYLYDKGVTANQVTLFAAVVSVLLGTLLLALPEHTWLVRPDPTVDDSAHGAERRRRHARPRVRPAIAARRLPQ